MERRQSGGKRKSEARGFVRRNKRVVELQDRGGGENELEVQEETQIGTVRGQLCHHHRVFLLQVTCSVPPSRLYLSARLLCRSSPSPLHPSSSPLSPSLATNDFKSLEQIKYSREPSRKLAPLLIIIRHCSSNLRQQGFNQHCQTCKGTARTPSLLPTDRTQ